MNEIIININDEKDYENKYNFNNLSTELSNYIYEECKGKPINNKISIIIKASYKIKDNVLTITDSTNRTYTNNYLLKFNKKLYKKYKGRTIKFVKGTLSKHCQVLSCNVEVSL